MKIGAIIQARTASTRLPDKVLKKLPYDSDVTVLDQVILRAKKSSKLTDIIVATTLKDEDAIIAKIAEKQGVRLFRGSEDNVLERYHFSAKENNLDIIVRITSDCPCIDPEIIDISIAQHLNEKADYTSNTIFRAFPHGMDTEVIAFNALERAYSEASHNYEVEHVTPYIYKSHPELFKISAVKASPEMSAPEIRVTLDTEEDYILLCAVFDYLYHKDNYFNLKDIIKLFREKPWLMLVNSKVVHKKLC